MSLDDAREINPVVFFPPGQDHAYTLDARPVEVEEETASPKDSSAPESVNSSPSPDDPDSTQTETESSSTPVPPAPPSPPATADKGNGPLKGNENSMPAGS